MLVEKRDLLIEVGVEELPASYIQPALESWVDYFDVRLQELRLHSSILESYRQFSTPRRLTLLIQGIKVRQEDQTVEKIGPGLQVALTEKGELSKAGLGFLRGSGVDVENISLQQLINSSDDSINEGKDSLYSENELIDRPYVKKTRKGEYLAIKQEIKGKTAFELLSEVCRESITKINFPKMMRWKEKNCRFARPIRWILAMYGGDTLFFTIGGVSSANQTYGNILEKNTSPITVDNIDEYLSRLEDNYVIAERDKRKEKIRQQLENNVKRLGGMIIDDNDELLEEVTDLVEYPTVVQGKYDERYLCLPVRVIHSTLAKNQRYFPIYKTKDRLIGNFLYIANNHPKYADNTIKGNERVVNARLADAQFYYNEDTERSIDQFNKELAVRVFHNKLGSIKEKVNRIVKISGYICEKLSVEEDLAKKVLRSAQICKFDLATSMIGEKEFTGLQGYIGREYALIWKEEPRIAQAIEEHYLPIGLRKTPNNNDDIPSDLIGQIVSLADKIDTLCAFFGIGIIPTGSKDQYGLRRAGNSIIKLIYESGLSIELVKLVDYTNSLLTSSADEELINFFKQRIGQYLQLRGVAYDVINAVLAIEFDEVIKAVNRAFAIQSVRGQEDFEHLILSFKRVSNIITAEKHIPAVNPELFAETGEKKLYDAIIHVSGKVDNLLLTYDYLNILNEFTSLNPNIDTFFDDVLVNVEEETIRNNRYALLNLLRLLFMKIGDLSLIVIN